ncbi:MAG: hypothetical protein Greene041662_814 [Candidatus Peregrinibacteria bacterium Greene0416_62]|nr:MAG: hypothetical protein Greene041662_814 [Candidatus Peregrinibacteria bacterium Greene0416_62]TSD00033.1 MAG: hypothetical protein Greene101449_393 [Candidatus Peregrinibacteria bacterium Greene1014_49]
MIRMIDAAIGEFLFTICGWTTILVVGGLILTEFALRAKAFLTGKE